MSIYVAYAAVVAHVALGYLQSGDNGAFVVVTVLSVAILTLLHLAAAWRDAHEEARQAEALRSVEAADWLGIGSPAAIADGRAKIVILDNGEKVAIYRHGNKLSALTNACAHQNGPLGEGRIVDGCVTCPWHGFQYRPEDGCAPAPFTEKVATYRLKLDGNQLYLDPAANPPGTYVEPVISPLEGHGEAA